ncbi:MAG: GNAT family N-acetyltransferase, partial [Gammaproteobacteria bacterium]|nr:GNAT family N-acetyltransferase [Gammaproteobacteria bacterium]
VWATLLRDAGECIGFHLLNHIQGETLIQVGYCLFRRHWGRGYATEMSVALLRYGFARLELPVISGITDQANLASQRVLLKAGLQRRGQRSFTHPAYAAAGPLAYFECRSAEWLATFSAQPESRIDEAL